MKLTIDENAVVCDMDEKNERFWRAVEYPFFRYSPRNQRRLKIEKTDHEYQRYGDAKADAEALWKVIGFADMYGVEVENSVREHLQHLYSEIRRIWQRYQEEDYAKARKQKCEYRMEYGCEGCQRLAYDEDVPVCTACQEALDRKNMPTYDGREGITYLIHLVPFPSDKCPLKVGPLSDCKDLLRLT